MPFVSGDVMLMVNPNGPRNLRTRDKIIRLCPGKEGRTRVMDLLTANKHTFRRPINVEKYFYLVNE